MLNSSSNITVIHPAPGVTNLYDQRGTSATVIQSESLPGVSFYSQQDKWGHTTQQGFLYDPIRKAEPLRVPPLEPYRDPLGALHGR